MIQQDNSACVEVNDPIPVDIYESTSHFQEIEHTPGSKQISLIDLNRKFTSNLEMAPSKESKSYMLFVMLRHFAW